MPFNVKWENDIYDVDDPLQAAKQAYKDICNGESLHFTVTNEDTGRTFSVDLSEVDEEAVLPIKE